MALSGILNVNKPSGLTSRRVVDIVQHLVRPERVGHAGTLDPLATGVLVVCVGSATKLIEYVQRMPKSYLGTFLLGRNSDTEDVEGEVVELADPPVPSLEEIVRVARSFIGEIMQRPPAFSALKINGRRAYKLARKGEEVELAPRPVSIYKIEVRSYQYPELELEIDCGGGTYIRTLGRNMAESLGTSAVMSALVRTGIGNFRLADALNPLILTNENIAGYMLPLAGAVDYLPRLELTAEEAVNVHHGRKIAQHNMSTSGEEIIAVDGEGKLLAILGPADDQLLRTLKNFS
jgi:tRNA pseudouridine55 synthase